MNPTVRSVILKYKKKQILLDNFIGVSFAISLRKIKTSDTNCVRVRRSSDNAEKDIGFVNDVIDVASLLDFVGAGNGYVTTWYDQSGNNNHATQSNTTMQPIIVNAGVLNGIRGKSAIYFDGVNDTFNTASAIVNANRNTKICAINSISKGTQVILGNSESDYMGFYGSNLTNYASSAATYGRGTLVDSTNDIRVITARQDGANFTAYNTGKILKGLATNYTSSTTPNLTGIGGFTTVTYKGFMSEIICFNVALSDSERNIIENDQISYHSVPSSDNIIICDGNSLTLGSYSTGGKDYPSVMNRALGGSSYVANFGVSGQTTANMIADAATQIDPIVLEGYRKNIVICWEGGNDFEVGGCTVAQAYNNIVSYCTARRSAGFKVIVGTVTPRAVTPFGTPTFEADRQSLNALLVSNWTSFADAICDVGNDPVIGQPGQETNLTYYRNNDYCHFTDAGYAVVANNFYNAVLTLL